METPKLPVATSCKCLAVLVWSMAFVVHSGRAQDALFTQQDLAPGLLNPALPGIEHPVQASALYRTQKFGAARPFRTVYAGLDLKPASLNKRSAENQSSGLGLGAYVCSDQGGDPEFRTVQFSTAMSYHVKLSDKSSVGAGLALGVDQHSVDPASGKWGSQYNGVVYDPSRPSGESFQADRQMHMDIGAGVVYHYQNKKKKVKVWKRSHARAGFSIYHAGRAELRSSDFFTHETERRYCAFTNGAIDLGKGYTSIEPGIWYHRQGSHQQWMLGAMFRYVINDAASFASRAEPSAVSGGMFLRVGDAITGRLLYEWSKYAIGIAYDFGTGVTIEGAPRRNAAEIALVYRR